MAAQTSQPYATREMTLEEWAAMDEDEPGELVDGQLVEEEVPDYLHEIVVAWFVWTLTSWQQAQGGWVAGSDAKFAVGPRRGRKPDVTVYFPGRLPPARGVVRLPPDIAIEVASPMARDQRRDRVDKLNDYAAFGVTWYWIVDPKLREIEIYELGADKRYVRALSGGEERIESVPGCHGLVLDLPALWAKVDRLGPPEETPTPPEGEDV